MYDAEGRLLIAILGTKAIWGGDKSTVKLCEMQWQPYHATADDALVRRLPTLAGATSSRAAEAIRALAVEKRARANGPVLVRVLDCVEEEKDAAAAEPPLLSALSASLAAEAGVVVEVYCATHSQELLDRLPVKVPAEAERWLRPRRALLPAALADLRGFAFDVMVLQGSVQRWGSLPDLRASLTRLACPGGLVLLRDLPEDEAGTVQQAFQGARACAVEGMVALRLDDVGHVERRGNRVLVVADSREQADRFSARLPSSSAVLLCGPGQALADEAGEEAWLAALRPLLPSSSGVDTAVFLAGMSDDGPLAARGYYRLLSLFRALVASQDPAKPSPIDVWVVTQRCHASERVQVGQASIYAITRHIESEVQGITVRHSLPAGTAC